VRGPEVGGCQIFSRIIIPLCYNVNSVNYWLVPTVLVHCELEARGCLLFQQASHYSCMSTSNTVFLHAGNGNRVFTLNMGTHITTLMHHHCSMHTSTRTHARTRTHTQTDRHTHSLKVWTSLPHYTLPSVSILELLSANFKEGFKNSLWGKKVKLPEFVSLGKVMDCLRLSSMLCTTNTPHLPLSFWDIYLTPTMHWGSHVLEILCRCYSWLISYYVAPSVWPIHHFSLWQLSPNQKCYWGDWRTEGPRTAAQRRLFLFTT
jgi:hypothetical protein